jgi:hypothetical protein
MTDNFRFGEIYNYYKNVYSNYTNQQLVLVPTNIDINTINTNALYGGDVFINPMGMQVRNSSATQRLQVLSVVESINNIGLRHDDKVNGYFYIPKQDNFNYPTESNAALFPSFDNYIAYNTDYSSIHNLIPIIVYKCPIDCSDIRTSDFPFRIARSTSLNAESKSIGWRRFLTNDYKELLDRGKGEIWKLEELNSSLVVYQKFTMVTFRVKDILATNTTDVYLGRGDIFDREPDELVPDGIGYVGNQSQWATVKCLHGLVHIDAQKGRVFLFTGKLEEISKKGVEQFLRDFGKISNDLDAPLQGNGYTATFDERYNRVLICKRSDDSFTLSYSFDFDCWTAFHDYYPTHMWFTRMGMFVSGLPFSGNYGIIYQFAKGNYGKFIQLDDEEQQITFEAYAECATNEPFEVQKQLASVYWLSTVIDIDGNELYDKTFTHAMVYTRTQCSGIIALKDNKTLVKESNNIRNSDYQWRLNDFRDIVKDKDLRILDNFGNLLPLNLNTFKAWFKQSKFFGRVFVIRLIYNNKDGNQILLKDVSPNIRKLAR